MKEEKKREKKQNKAKKKNSAEMLHSMLIVRWMHGFNFRAKLLERLMTISNRLLKPKENQYPPQINELQLL